jgi:L-ascorbate metabolism protein UlaG (beta-lactamase superfamily)
MVISYYGAECFKVQFGDLTLAFNPPSKDSKEKSPKFGADVAFVTTAHPDFNGVEQVSFGDKKPFVISGPGEYELKGITARGFLSETKYGGEKRINTIYKISLEGINLVFLGPLSDAALSADVKSEIEDADILFVPIGGGDVLDAGIAHKLAVGIEPSMIIPMHYGDGKDKELAKFLKECGENPAPVEKLTIKKKDIEGKKGEVAVLQNNV